MQFILVLFILFISIAFLSVRDALSNKLAMPVEAMAKSLAKPEAYRQCVETKRNTSMGIELNGRSFNSGLMWYITLNNPESGMLVGQDDSILTGQVLLEEKNKLTYTPDRDFVGTDRFYFVVYDGEEISEVAYVVIKVTDRELVSYSAVAMQDTSDLQSVLITSL